MQLMLPIFAAHTEMITENLGVCKKDGIITYVHCGVPIFTHREDDHHSFRYITSKYVLQGLCRMIDICNCFHVSYDSVKRYVKRLEECGDKGFFTEDNRNGGCRYKLLPAVLERMQVYLDQGKSNSEIARLEGVSEGAIRYAIKTGALKKTNPQATLREAIEPSGV
jgi:transposase